MVLYLHLTDCILDWDWTQDHLYSKGRVSGETTVLSRAPHYNFSPLLFLLWKPLRIRGAGREELGSASNWCPPPTQIILNSLCYDSYIRSLKSASILLKLLYTIKCYDPYHFSEFISSLSLEISTLFFISQISTWYTLLFLKLKVYEVLNVARFKHSTP